jgi:hypothetical protein
LKLEEFINLNKISKRILKKYKDSNNILSIRQLHIMRPHPVLMDEYTISNKFSKKNIDTKNSIFYLFDFIKNIFFETQLFYPQRKIDKKVDCIFLTHLINVKHINKKNDFYFANLPNFLEKKKFNCLKIYRNLTDKTSLSIYNNNKKNLDKNFILSKSTKFFDEIKLFTKFLYSLILINKLKLIDKDIKKFFYGNTVKFIGSSCNNLRLLNQVIYIINNLKPKYFFITLEGHAWEKLLIYNIKKEFPRTKIIAYQFSIVTKYSQSLYLNLGKNFMPDAILTCGNFTKKEFDKKIKKNQNLINIGSNKYAQKYPNADDKYVLVIPEGFNSETLKMFEFTFRAAIEIKNKKFIFRCHPMINVNQFVKSFLKKKKMNIPSNLIISKNTFDYDLKKSKYVIYRGSAAAIQALGSQRLVIYLKFPKEINIDPLFMIKNKLYVEKILHLKKIFNNRKKIKKNYQNFEITKEYFSKINYNDLLKKLKNEKI